MVDNLLPPAASPTGRAVIPPVLVPWLGVLALAIETAAQTLPPHTIAARLAHGAALLIGIFSPGLRR